MISRSPRSPWGGIVTEGLDQTTMLAKAVPGLYCIGEAVDITGWLGGFNMAGLLPGIGAAIITGLVSWVAGWFIGDKKD